MAWWRSETASDPWGIETATIVSKETEKFFPFLFLFPSFSFCFLYHFSFCLSFFVYCSLLACSVLRSIKLSHLFVVVRGVKTSSPHKSSNGKKCVDRFPSFTVVRREPTPLLHKLHFATSHRCQYRHCCMPRDTNTYFGIESFCLLLCLPLYWILSTTCYDCYYRACDVQKKVVGEAFARVIFTTYIYRDIKSFSILKVSKYRRHWLYEMIVGRKEGC